MRLRSNSCAKVALLAFLLLVEQCEHFSRYGHAHVKFTNVKCTSWDKQFADFRYCRLKVPNRATVSMSLHVELHQVPVNNVSINMSLLKRGNGYRPFLYNISTNFCEFMAHQKRYPFPKIIFGTLTNDSNINHTCPYDHDIIIQNWVIEDHMLVLLPLPSGDYMINLQVGVYNVWRAVVQVYLTLLENI